MTFWLESLLRADTVVIVPEIAPGPKDIVIGKQKPSAFYGTPLQSYLTHLQCDSVLVTGTTTTLGGPAQALFSTSPDNQANRGAFGTQLKFKRQTRITADVAFGTWTQNAAFLPFTLNSVILTGTGIPANTTAALPQQSLNGKINTTSVNFGFSSRPVENLTMRLRFRSYDLTNKTTPISWHGGSTADSPDRAWGAVAASADAPYGYATANLYDNSSQRFDAQVGYDIKDLTLEAAFRTAALKRTSREATSPMPPHSWWLLHRPARTRRQTDAA